MIKLFYCPLMYFFFTRTKSRVMTLSWFLIYMMPILIFSYFNSYTLSDIYLAILAIIHIYSFYETGYIYNDAETIKRESNPTLRLNKTQLFYYEDHKSLIYISKLLIGIVISVVLYLNEQSEVVRNYIVLSILMLIVFFIYNSVRSRFNLLLHFLLVILRFGLPFYLVSGSITIFLLSICLFPLLNLFERCSETRFQLHYFYDFIFSNKTTGRYLYYLFMLFVFLFIEYFSNFEIENFRIFIGLLFYMFCYRYFSLKLVRMRD